MQPRLMRLDDEHDAHVLAKLCGRLVVDPNLRGWAAIAPVLPAQSLHVVRESLARLRVHLVSGASAWALVGDTFTLFAAGRELFERREPDIARTGAWLRDAAQAVDSAPKPVSCGSAQFDWTRPVVMGVVNVTPDSFSDGGLFLEPAFAVEHGLRLVEEGADLLDVGGESTRPRGAAYGAGAVTVSDADEIARIVPVIRGIRARSAIPISVDTRKAAVARAALEAGASMINDVTGLKHDAELARVAAEAKVPLCLMHTPADIEALAHEQPSDDVVGDVLAGLSQSLAAALEAGVERRNLWLDPGIGFGKTAAHNWYLVRHLESLAALGLPVLVGLSRKSSIARAAAGDGPVPEPSDRLGASVGGAVTAYLRGAHVLRVHDVKASVQALRVAAALRTASDAGAALQTD